MTKAIRNSSARVTRAQESRVYGAPYTQPSRRRWRAERTRGDILLAARLGWTHRDRGNANLAHGQRVHQYSGDSFPEQVRAWSRIVESVHQSGGRIFLQLWHVGRISHSSLLPNNAQPVAPSAIRANSQTLIATGLAQVAEPVALTASGIKGTLDDYRRAAGNAKEAGFDGVEIHAANGYLIDQFLRTGSNRRTDEYGGVASNESAFSQQQLNTFSKPGTAGMWVCESLLRLALTI